MKTGKKIKLLITGASGLTGKTATEYFGALDPYQVISLTRKDLDITDRKKVEESIKTFQPDYILNCAAYTRVDQAEAEKEKCYAVNVTGIENLARASLETGSTVIHLSTDYVFDGTKKTPYCETDPKNPISHYGLTKSLGEDKLQEITRKHFIIRPAWIYGKYGDNFFTKLLTWSHQNPVLKIADDQTGTPTYAGDLVQFIRFVIENAPDQFGIYHFTNEGQATRYEQAEEILRLLGRTNRIIPVASSEFNPMARRPAYSVLSKEKIKKLWQYPVKHWKESLRQFIKEHYDNKS